jgi:hypothetical protein
LILSPKRVEGDGIENMHYGFLGQVRIGLGLKGEIVWISSQRNGNLMAETEKELVPLGSCQALPKYCGRRSKGGKIQSRPLPLIEIHPLSITINYYIYELH